MLKASALSIEHAEDTWDSVAPEVVLQVVLPCT